MATRHCRPRGSAIAEALPAGHLPTDRGLYRKRMTLTICLNVLDGPAQRRPRWTALARAMSAIDSALWDLDTAARPMCRCFRLLRRLSTLAYPCYAGASTTPLALSVERAFGKQTTTIRQGLSRSQHQDESGTTRSNQHLTCQLCVGHSSASISAMASSYGGRN